MSQFEYVNGTRTMLLETFDLGYEVRTLHLIAGLFLGLIFGAAAQVSRFCLRRAVAGEPSERGSAAAVWATGFAAAIVGFASLRSTSFAELDGHRFLNPDLPIAAIMLGGLSFGVGMVLTRGCVSRLTVLSATGNLRALTVLALFAVTAHATLKGVFAPIRTSLGALTTELPFGSLFDVPLGGAAFPAIAVLLAAFLVWRARASAVHVLLGAVIGFVAIGGWVVTSTLLFDEFDPLPVQSAAFTLPWSDSLFWLIASSAIPAGFGVGFIGGVVGGSFLSASLRGELQLQSFSAPGETLRYGAGGMLMGFGGVLAGGCTVGAGLSGSAMGSVAALIALASIILGAKIASVALSGQTTAQITPAE